MRSKVYLGSICIMLEDLGFTVREPSQEFIAMSYFYHDTTYYDKIFADITNHWMLEICLTNEMHIDSWHRNEMGLFIVKDEETFDLHKSNSIDLASQFVNSIIKVAHGLY